MTTTSAQHTQPESSSLYFSYTQQDPKTLEGVFLRGTTPRREDLVGWEFRGMNAPWWAAVLGIKKFIKGFYESPDGDLMGYNIPVKQNLKSPTWIAKPLDHDPKRFGFYTVDPVDPVSTDNAYLHALLLNYGKGPNPPLDPSRGLRDYLVQIDPDNPDLFLGKAYYALPANLRIATNFFLLERHRPAPKSLAV